MSYTFLNDFPFVTLEDKSPCGYVVVWLYRVKPTTFLQFSGEIDISDLLENTSLLSMAYPNPKILRALERAELLLGKEEMGRFLNLNCFWIDSNGDWG